MYELPTAVTVNDREYNIREKGDFRIIIKIIEICQDLDLTDQERSIAALTVFYENVNNYDDIFIIFDDLQEAVNSMMNFVSCDNSEDIGYKAKGKVIDWIQDEKLIIAEINKVAGKEVRAESYVHWWTLIGYFMTIEEGSLSMIVGIRDKIASGKKLEKYEREFKQQNPHYFRWRNKSAEEIQVENEIMELWKDNK